MRCYLSTENSPTRQSLYERPSRGCIQAAVLEALELQEDAGENTLGTTDAMICNGPMGNPTVSCNRALAEAIEETLLPGIEEILTRERGVWTPSGMVGGI